MPFTDKQDLIWLSDFGANALVQFNPNSETLNHSHYRASSGASTLDARRNVSQSGTDKLW
jgi:streptogramin lyase